MDVAFYYGSRFVFLSLLVNIEMTQKLEGEIVVMRKQGYQSSG